MKYSVRGYLLTRGLSLESLFRKAWKEHFRQEPAYSSIMVDVETFIAVGAVPPYVLAYMKNNPASKKVYKPYWIAA